MKTKKKWFIRSVLVLTTLGLVACKPDSPEEKAEWIQNKVTKKLELTEVQQEKLKSVIDLGLKLHEDRRGQKSKMKDQAQALLKQDKISAEDLLKLKDSHQAGMNEALGQVAQPLAEFINSLDTKQKEKLSQFIDKFHSKRKGRSCRH